MGHHKHKNKEEDNFVQTSESFETRKQAQLLINETRKHVMDGFDQADF